MLKNIARPDLLLTAQFYIPPLHSNLVTRRFYDVCIITRCGRLMALDTFHASVETVARRRQKELAMNPESSLQAIFRKGFLALGVLAAVGLVGYGLTDIIVMPQVSPEGFVPQTLSVRAGSPLGLGTILAAFVLVYAFAFLPVSILFTVKQYRVNPYALVLACSLIDISFLIEIINSLPLMAVGIYPGQLATISPETLLYLRQVEMLKFLSYDVAGFTLAYAAIFVYAIVYFRSHRLLSYTVIASIVLFIANVPCLWFAPNAAVILMAMSIFAFAPVPSFLARMAVE